MCSRARKSSGGRGKRRHFRIRGPEPLGLACCVHYPGRGQLTEKQADMRSSGASTGVIGRAAHGAAHPGDKGMAAIGVVLRRL